MVWEEALIEFIEEVACAGERTDVWAQIALAMTVAMAVAMAVACGGLGERRRRRSW